MNYSYLLLALLLIPGSGAVLCATMPSGRAARAWALIVSLATAAVMVAIMAVAPWWAVPAPVVSASPLRFFLLDLPALPGTALYLDSLGFSFSLAMDSISMWLTALTVFLTPLAIAASWQSIQDRAKQYYAWMLLLLMAMIGVFIARDLLLFYVFFELTLVPMFFIIGIWGGPDRRRAAGRFFLFTFAGSVLTLAAVIYLGLGAGEDGSPSFDLMDVLFRARVGLSETERFWIFLALLAGFAVKVPLFPVHTWLPLAHTEAPTAGSVILAGVLLKLGTYGLLRLAVPIGMVTRADVLFPTLLAVLGVICVIGIIYGALVAWVQPDIKKLVAYSSVSHLGFCVLGLLALNVIGIEGSVLYMINHGLSTGALFLVVGMVYDRYHTRDINELSGLGRRMPRLAFFFVLFALSSIGLPGLNGFVSEFLTILGAFTSGHLGISYGVIGALGIILGAVYMLHMVARVIFGPLKLPATADEGHGGGAGGVQHTQDLGRVRAHGQADQGQAASPGHPDADHGDALPTDIGGREIAVLAPLALAVILLGVLPNIVLESIRGPVQWLVPAGFVADGDGDRPGARPRLLQTRADQPQGPAAPAPVHPQHDATSSLVTATTP